MIRSIGLAVVLVAVASGGYFAHSLLHPAPAPAADPVRHVPRPSGPTIEQVHKLAELVALRTEISDVHVSELTGFTGGLKLVLAVHGDVEVTTDLSTAAFEEVDPQNKTAVLTLQTPAPARPRLDHEKTRILSIERNGLWRWVDGQAGEKELTNRAMAHAQKLLGETAERRDLMTQGCAHTEKVIREFFAAMGWTVTVAWEDAPGGG